MGAKARKIIVRIVCAIIICYIILINGLVSGALIPSFMERLPLFEQITDFCLSQQAHTEELDERISVNRKKLDDWIESKNPEYLEKMTTDGYKLIAQKFTSEEDSHKWALVLHGYTGKKEEMYAFVKHYNYTLGYHVIVPDLRAQGESEGDYIGMGWSDRLDCMLWLDYILEQDPEAQIVIHGQSMGASTALMMSGEALPDNVKAIISDCAYTDAFSMFSRKATEWLHLPSFPFVDSVNLMFQLRGGYDLRKASSLEAVKNSITPTLFIHGSEDQMISVKMCEELYEAASCEKQILIIEGAGHAQSVDMDPTLFYNTMDQFVATYVKD